MRAAFDTNVLVAAVATRGLCADLLSLVLARHELIVGETVLGELPRVLVAKMRVPEHLVDQYLGLLRAEATIAPAVRVSSGTALPLRDPSDLPVLLEAIATGAEVLVTGDNDLLQFEAALPLEVVNPRGLWERLRAGAGPAGPAAP